MLCTVDGFKHVSCLQRTTIITSIKIIKLFYYILTDQFIMALYDNKHWLLSHIRNSFISTDDTGMCELVMATEDFPKQLAEKLNCGYYSPIEDSEDDDDIDIPESYDIQLDMDFGMHRMRSNTAQRLEKLELAQKKAAKIKHVKWTPAPQIISEEEMKNIFSKRDYKSEKITKESLLTLQLKKYTNLPQNPYLEFAKFDGNAQVGIPIRKYKIFLTMLPEEQRNYPINICVIATAKVAELIGLILLKCSTNHGDFPLEPVSNYGLYFTEDDGEVDRDFPCLDSRECVAKFGFTCLGLVEHKNVKNVSFESTELFVRRERPEEKEDSEAVRISQDNENMAKMKVLKTAMEAPLYQCYKVFIIHKVLTKTEIHLGISGDKIEIDPVQQKNSKFWVRQKAVSYHMDSVAWCEILDKKSGRATFRLVYSLSHMNQPVDVSSMAGTSHSPMLQTSASFKHYDFEADQITAHEIVQKINLILELRSSASRKEYLTAREKKVNRKKSFHIGSKT